MHDAQTESQHIISMLLCLNTHADILLMYLLFMPRSIYFMLVIFILFTFKQYHAYKWECCNKIVNCLTTEMDSSLVPVSFRMWFDFDLNEAIDVYNSIDVYDFIT